MKIEEVIDKYDRLSMEEQDPKIRSIYREMVHDARNVQQEITLKAAIEAALMERRKIENKV